MLTISIILHDVGSYDIACTREGAESDPCVFLERPANIFDVRFYAALQHINLNLKWKPWIRGANRKVDQQLREAAIKLK